MKEARALIIEDSDLLAALFGHALEAAGYNTEIFTDGEKGFHRLSEVTPDMVLLDLNLPFVSGETILNWIRTNDRLKKTRVIIVSANGTHATQLGQKADLVLQKPVTYQQILSLSDRLHPANANRPTI